MKAKALLSIWLDVEVEIPLELVDADDDDAVWEAVDDYVSDLEDKGIKELLEQATKITHFTIDEISDYDLTVE